MTKHDETGRRIARKEGADYSKGPGPDVITKSQATEVETSQTVGDAARQLAGFKRPVYVAGADAEATKKAVEHYKGTTIGAKNPQGKVVKPSTRKRK